MREEHLAAHRRAIRRVDRTIRHRHDAITALDHDLHVGRHDRVAELAEFLHILLADDLSEVALGDVEVLQQGRDLEERTEEGVALHAQLEFRPGGRLLRDVEAGQREDADLFLDDRAPVFRRDSLPRLLGRLVRFPDEHAAVDHAVERIDVGERLRVATEHDIDVAQVAVHPRALRTGDEKESGGRAFLFRTVLRVGRDVDHLADVAARVAHVALLGDLFADLADDLGEILARRDHAPAADGVQAHGDGSFRQEGRCFLRNDAIGMVNPEGEERLPVVAVLAVLAGDPTGRILVRADDVLGTKVAGAEAVNA